MRCTTHSSGVYWCVREVSCGAPLGCWELPRPMPVPAEGYRDTLVREEAMYVCVCWRSDTVTLESHSSPVLFLGRRCTL